MAVAETVNCISCGTGITGRGSAQFPCPRCGTMIARCSGCREQSVAFTCRSCDFGGP
jgi:Zn-ribbon RNA-binding protein